MKEIEKLLFSEKTKQELLGKSQEELIHLVLRLQEGNKDLWDAYQRLYKSGSKRSENHDETIKGYMDKMEEYYRMYLYAELKNEEYKKIVDLKLGNAYDINATWIDKIVFVLKQAGRPLRSSEIIDVLERNDITFRTLADKQKGLSAHLTKALQYGRIIGEKQKGRNGYLFSLPKEI